MSNQDSFEKEVIQKSFEKPVLVDFWAPWCGPCRILGPTLDRLTRQSKGRFRLVKINSDHHPELNARFAIRGIPAVKLFKDGEVIDEFVGALPEHAVREWLDRALGEESAA